MVDLIDEDRVVGYAYVDDDQMIVEFLPDDAGRPWPFEASDLQRVLDVAAAMLAPDQAATDLAEGAGPDGLDVIASEFDTTARRRGDEDEGFYPLEAAAHMARRCGDLGLAMASLEGFTLHEEEVVPVAGCAVDLADAHRGEPWPTFQAGCNVQAEAVLERWPRRADFAVAVEVIDQEGERFVL